MRIIIGALALLVPATAQADVAGRYEVDGQPLVIEANDDGRVRIDSANPGEYTLLMPDGGYIVFTDEGGLKVASMANFTAAADEMMAEMWGELGADSSDVTPDAPTGERLVMETVGEEDVNGRTGTVYREATSPDASEDGGETPKPAEIVLTDDLTLAPLGEAWSRMVTMMPSFGRLISGGATAQEIDFANLLKGKGVLRLDTITLANVSFDPIADDRFVLPAEPMSKDEVKAMFMSSAAE